MNLRDVRWYAVYGLTIGLIVWGVYRRIVLAPLMLPVMVGLLLAAVAPPRLALSAALAWLLGSADDLADWVRLWRASGAVTHRPGEGLRLEAKR